MDQQFAICGRTSTNSSATIKIETGIGGNFIENTDNIIKFRYEELRKYAKD